MPPFNEDISLFFDSAFGFAVKASLDGQPVIGIFDRPGTTTEASGLGVAASVPTFVMPETAAATQSTGKNLIITGTTWVVADAQPDGTGLITLLLEKP